MDNIVELKSVYKSYTSATKKWAIEDINLEIKEGEFFCLVGPSGCGKSTLLKIIAKIERPTSGQITAPANISMVFQSGALLPWLTAEDNVAFGLRMIKTPEHSIHGIVSEYLKMVKMEGFHKKFPRELSGGQRQRVGIARALATKPKVLLLDEPFSALDPLTTAELHKDLLKIWNDTKITVIMVSHLLEEAIYLGERVGVMNQGAIRKIVDINLQMPRNVRTEGFYKLEDELIRLL